MQKWATDVKDADEFQGALKSNKINGVALLGLTEEKLLKEPYKLTGGAATSLAAAVGRLNDLGTCCRFADISQGFRLADREEQLEKVAKEKAEKLSEARERAKVTADKITQKEANVVKLQAEIKESDDELNVWKGLQDLKKQLTKDIKDKDMYLKQPPPPSLQDNINKLETQIKAKEATLKKTKTLTDVKEVEADTQTLRNQVLAEMKAIKELKNESDTLEKQVNEMKVEHESSLQQLKECREEHKWYRWRTFWKGNLRTTGDVMKAVVSLAAAAGFFTLWGTWYYSDERVALRTIPEATAGKPKADPYVTREDLDTLLSKALESPFDPKKNHSYIFVGEKQVGKTSSILNSVQGRKGVIHIQIDVGKSLQATAVHLMEAMGIKHTPYSQGSETDGERRTIVIIFSILTCLGLLSRQM